MRLCISPDIIYSAGRPDRISCPKIDDVTLAKLFRKHHIAVIWDLHE